MRWELEAERRTLTEEERRTCLETRKRWVEMENEYGNMLRQKARIKWDVEGDENSKFFHSYVKRRNNKSNIRGLVINGVWCEDSKLIKMEMARHYKSLFSEQREARPIFCSDRLEKISEDDARVLEKEFNEEEVWEAIRGCGGDKAPGPDGFNFKFIRRFWDVIKSDLMRAVLWFWEKMDISRGCNSSFITIIPKVPDPIGLGDFWPISLIGCYYKIIAKMLEERVKRVVGSVVGEVQSAFIKGRYILDGVLIANEMLDFLKRSMQKGIILKWILKRRDPLSPFLFILAAEGLNAIVNEAMEIGIFRGVKVGANNVMVSHLQYADDTIFFGDWNRENTKSLMCILKCFEEVSGLRVNYNKSKLYGIGVSDVDLMDMAGWMRCAVGEFPFTYLGLSIGVGKEMDGLGLEFSSSCRGVLRDGCNIKFWLDRWVDDRRLCDRFSRLFHQDRAKEGSVKDKGKWVNESWIWEWDWVRTIRVRVCKELEDLVSVLQNVVVSYNCRDRWKWTLCEDGEFKVKDLSRLIEETILHVESGTQETLWNKLVPRKVNIFIWRALKGRLLVRAELDKRGIDLDSVLCPCCTNAVESCAHSLIMCDLAMSVWNKVFNWWKLGSVNAFSIGEFFSSYGNVNVPNSISRVWQAVI
ncbi:reverse transcriptase domain, reverse transcriptase zinc-binding domain protein [Tanacetum coccineum]